MRLKLKKMIMDFLLYQIWFKSDVEEEEEEEEEGPDIAIEYILIYLVKSIHNKTFPICYFPWTVGTITGT